MRCQTLHPSSEIATFSKSKFAPYFSKIIPPIKPRPLPNNFPHLNFRPQPPPPTQSKPTPPLSHSSTRAFSGMPHFRKPSASGLLYSPLKGNFSEGRLRLLLTKRGIVYGSTVLFLLVLLSLMITGVPDTKEVGSLWSSTQQGAANSGRTTSIQPLDDVVLPPHIQHDDSRFQTSITSSVTTSTSVPVGTAHLTPPTHHLQDDKHTEDGFPLISTHNNGKLVILTGATGRGNFFEIPDFYPQIVKNRLDYVNHHGIPTHSPVRPVTDLVRV